MVWRKLTFLCWQKTASLLLAMLLITLLGGLSVLCEQPGPWPGRHASQLPIDTDAASLKPLSPGSTASQLAAAIS
jgi:hypothetical protein